MLNMFKPGVARSLQDNKKLGAVFCWIGGYVNGVGITLVGITIANMSVNLAQLGKGMGLLQFEEILIIIPLMLSFIFGSTVGGYFYKRYSYQPVLVSEAFLLMFMGDVDIKIMIFLGALAMGLHNAFTTSISNGDIRSSHITNSVTDIGISLARKNMGDVWLKLITVGSYMTGAAMGVIGFQFWGKNAFTFAAITILGLLAADALRKPCEEDYIGNIYRKLVCKVLDL
ncbi:MAG: DUF1275 domain-containing protein [Candidatus Schekmanbacteria bacterium]|nr:DUF1275 domain-containing protein [Candidatus Schekmanbacteria bacterium]